MSFGGILLADGCPMSVLVVTASNNKMPLKLIREKSLKDFIFIYFKV